MAANGPAPDAGPPAAAPVAPLLQPARHSRAVWLLALALLAVLALGVWAAVQLQRQQEALRQSLNKMQADSAAAAGAYEQQLRAARSETQGLAAELERLRDQRTELDQLYLDLTRGRDEAALVEVERLIGMAAQSLQISGDIGTAVAALQAADARLARIDRPQLLNLRRTVARDLDRLRSAPAVDITGQAVRIDQLINAVDSWPLLAEPPPKSKAPETRKPAPVPATGADDWWARLRQWLNEEFGDLLRIREVETPEALLLTEAQQRLARQQMRLRLLNARQSLLLRNDRLYRADLAETQALLSRYFDTRQPAVVGAATQLRSLAQAPLSVDVPQITDSLNALRSARPGR